MENDLRLGKVSMSPRILEIKEEEIKGRGIISLMSSSGVEKLYRTNGEGSGEGLEMWTRLIGFDIELPRLIFSCLLRSKTKSPTKQSSSFVSTSVYPIYYIFLYCSFPRGLILKSVASTLREKLILKYVGPVFLIK